MTFSRWWTSARDKKARQLHWIWGPETVLADYVVDHLLHELRPAPNNLVGVRAGETTPHAIVELLCQAPLDPRSPRVVVVRDADKIDDWSRLEWWLHEKRYFPGTYLVLLSNEDKLPYVDDEEGNKVVAPHIAALRKASARMVHATEFTEASASIAVAWVQSLYAMKPNVAGHLLNRADGQLRVVRDTAVKLRALEREASIVLINELLPQAPRDTFVDALLHKDRRTAIARLSSTRNAEYRREVARLDSMLTFMSQLHHFQARGASYADMSRELQGRAFLIKEFIGDAKSYDDKAVMRRRALLALSDSVLAAISRQQVTAVMEALVLNW